MKVELLVSEWCPTCPQAERVWRQVAAERAIEFHVLDMAQPEGRALVAALRLKTVPSTIIDGELKAVGVPGLDQARALVAGAPVRARSSPSYVGLLLSAPDRACIVSAMGYLLAAGAWLLVHGTLAAAGVLRPVGLHLFFAGFVAFLIFGLAGHMLPRFTGHPIRAGGWAWAQFGLAHAGLAVFLAGWLAGSRSLIIAGGAGLWLAFALFAARMWPVLRAPAGGQAGAES